MAVKNNMGMKTTIPQMKISTSGDMIGSFGPFGPLAPKV
jgi:hypothetical protein